MVARRWRGLVLAASAGLSILTVACWVRSVYACDMLRWTTMRHHWLVQSFAGRVHMVRYRFDDPAVLESYRTDPRYEKIERRRMTVDPTAWEHFGFSYSRHVSDWGIGGRASKGTVWWLSLPHWFVVLVLATPAGAVAPGLIKQRRHDRRLREVRCTSCGYDLRATPDQCPECGRAVPAAADR